MAAVVAERGAECCLMHMRGEPRTMQDDPHYDDVVADVKAFLEDRMAFAVAAGIAEERILFDPGIGFGKTREHNLELVRRLRELAALGRPLVIGASRKSFLGRITGREVGERVAATRRDQRARLRARGQRIPRARRRARLMTRSRSRLLRSAAMAEDDADEFDEVDDVDDDEGGSEPEVTIEISGLSLFTHVGVTAAEREVGQRLLLDLRLDVGECDATLTDRIEDTIDYGQVCELATLVAQQRSYKTLERLCAAIADRLLSTSTARTRCGSRRPSPSRRSRCRCPRCRSRCGARPRASSASGGRQWRAPRYLGLGSNIGERAGASAGRGRALRTDGVTVLASSSHLRDRAGRADPRPARVPQRLPADRDRARSPRSCSTPARRPSARSAARPAARGTGRG